MFKKLSMGGNMNSAELEDFKDAKEQLKFNAMMMDDYALTKEEKLEN